VIVELAHTTAVVHACGNLLPVPTPLHRLWVLYALTAVLLLMLGTIALRYAVFCTVWVVTGHHLWIMPNLMSEKVSVHVCHACVCMCVCVCERERESWCVCVCVCI
jgi:hypothetical protein